MFCPNCGNQLPDGAKFCGSCGTEVRVNATPRATQGPTVGEAFDAASVRVSKVVDGVKASGIPDAAAVQVSKVVDGVKASGVDQMAATGVAKAKKLPIIPLAAAAVVLIGIIIFATGAFGSSGGSPAPAPSVTTGTTGAGSDSGSGSSSSKGGASYSLTENAPNRISPKEDIVISDLKLETDKINRWVITGKAQNKSNEALDAVVGFSAVEHSSDKYGEEQTKSVDVHGSTITPFCETEGARLEMFDLQGGEMREFTIYPSNWGDLELSYSDPSATVVGASLPDAQRTTRYDHDNNIEITKLEYSADGKCTGEFKNNSDMYLSQVKFVLRAYNNEDVPVVDWSEDRPIGTKLFYANAETLKPGDTGTFTANVGEGCSKVDLLHILLTPDKEKGGWK